MMKYKVAGNILLILLGALFIFHWIVLLGSIPSNIVWAGNIKSSKDLVRLEVISIIISSIALIIVALKLRYLNIGNHRFPINTGLWTLFVLFTLNTIANITASNPIEKYGFGSLTLILTLLILRILLESKNNSIHE